MAGTLTMPQLAADPSAPAAGRNLIYMLDDGIYLMRAGETPEKLLTGKALGSLPAECRLSLSSTVANTTADVTAATSVYLHQWMGKYLALYDGASWNSLEVPNTPASVSLAGLTADKNYDVFGYINGSAIALETLVWTDNANRATALTLQDGRLVKTGATTRLYLGTVRTTATVGQCEDSLSKRFLHSYFNPKMKQVKFYEATSHTYGTGAYRYWNNASTAKFEFVVGQGTFATLNIGGLVNNGGSMTVGINTTTNNMLKTFGGCTAAYTGRNMMAETMLFAEGYYSINVLEYGSATPATLTDVQAFINLLR